MGGPGAGGQRRGSARSARGPSSPPDGQDLISGDFSYTVHPFKFDSATGLTPHLYAVKNQKDPAEPKVPSLSGFGGKHHGSKRWLTPRGERAADRSTPRYPSGSQTERGTSRRRDGGSRPDRLLQRKPTQGFQSVQGMTWRFLREGPKKDRRERDPMMDAVSQSWGYSEREEAFARLLKGPGENVQEEYRQFEMAVQSRLAQESAKEKSAAESYSEIAKEIEDGKLKRFLGDEEDMNDMSQIQESRDGYSGDEVIDEVEDDEFHETELPPAHSAQFDQGTPATTAHQEKDAAVNQSADAKKVDESAAVDQSEQEEPGEEEDAQEDQDDFLLNPTMAPCVIWHTPMRVKIAANLPAELRNEVDSDEAFVKDDRVVPDIWDHKFLPVNRRSVAAPIPKESPRFRSQNYGAWYLPVQQWKAVEHKTLRGQAITANKAEDDVPSLMDKMEKEIVKLSSSKMFYHWLKKEGLRVPRYLKRMETGDVND